MQPQTVSPAPLLTADEHHELKRLRRGRRVRKPLDIDGTAGQRLADRVAGAVGSWPFISVQSALLAAWIVANAAGWIRWDPYPFILLNLLLSFQAAYTAPMILMSQNRQSDLDRAAANLDYEVNRKSELEIELLHQKIDLLREQEIAALTRLVERLEATLLARDARPATGDS